MTPYVKYLLYFTGILFIAQTVSSLSCYRCVSTEPGCGQELNIRLQRWHGCDDMGVGGGENFCVKTIKRQGGADVITRDCLKNLLGDTTYRLTMPTVRRHGYCSFGRNDDPWNPYNKDLMFCFCNDWNGCNSAPSQHTKWLMTGIISSIVVFLVRMFV